MLSEDEDFKGRWKGKHPVTITNIMLHGTQNLLEPSPNCPTHIFQKSSVLPMKMEDTRADIYKKLNDKIRVLKNWKCRLEALGEVGLDRTTPSHTWARQEEVLRRVITIPTDDQILMLHLRGSKGDPYGSDVQGLALRLVKEKLPPTRVVHLHSFTGRASDVTAWLAEFPSTYFSVNSLVQGFDRWQKEGLRSIPWNRLLLETDSPHLSPGGWGINTPHMIGDVAMLVAQARGVPVEEVLRCSTSNARAIYRIP
ncbi:putative deoxyribonuclease TATDN3 [Haliotis cracherodii]|uniref:putative deoxyribonuclease TATDN3 n=1 Tax=Haliotis cracherodii TaxID=6455 RepID=UPI0039E8B287